jgi:hypothetical protein
MVCGVVEDVVDVFRVEVLKFVGVDVVEVPQRSQGEICLQAEFLEVNRIVRTL